MVNLMKVGVSSLLHSAQTAFDTKLDLLYTKFAAIANRELKLPLSEAKPKEVCEYLFLFHYVVAQEKNEAN